MNWGLTQIIQLTYYSQSTRYIQISHELYLMIYIYIYYVFYTSIDIAQPQLSSPVHSPFLRMISVVSAVSGSVVAEVPQEVGKEVRALKKALAPQVGRRESPWDPHGFGG